MNPRVGVAWLERLLASYLRRRGWVVFWLDERSQFCSAEVNYSLGRGVCWIRCYRQSEAQPDFPEEIQPFYERRLEELQNATKAGEEKD